MQCSQWSIAPHYFTGMLQQWCNRERCLWSVSTSLPEQKNPFRVVWCDFPAFSCLQGPPFDMQSMSESWSFCQADRLMFAWLSARTVLTWKSTHCGSYCSRGQTKPTNTSLVLRDGKGKPCSNMFWVNMGKLRSKKSSDDVKRVHSHGCQA